MNDEKKKTDKKKNKAYRGNGVSRKHPNFKRMSCVQLYLRDIFMQFNFICYVLCIDNNNITNDSEESSFNRIIGEHFQTFQ